LDVNYHHQLYLFHQVIEYLVMDVQ
jgi:hypothetical protein